MSTDSIDRRRFLAHAAAAVTGAVACRASATEPGSANPELLSARVTAPTATVATGLQPLGLGTSRDGLLYVPTTYRATEPLPLLVLLHGAGGAAANWFGSYTERAESNRFIVVAPESRSSTWDVVQGGAFGVDVQFIDRVLAWTFERCAIRAGRIALGGFSDGGTYALSLGLANGELFDHVIAYSPGFFVASHQRGTPKLFISHGRADTVLPIDRASRVLVPRFRGAGYSVEYVEFDGPHQVPSFISDQAMAWLAADYVR